MKTIVIAYDGSECSEAIFSELGHAGLPLPLTAHVVAVAPLWAAPAKNPEVTASAAEEADAGRRTRALAEQGARRLQTVFPTWKVVPTGLSGSVARTIVQRAQEVEADLILIGAHSRSLAGRFFLGSVSQKVAEEGKCSVRICRPLPRHGASLRLLVALDGSESSWAAVHWVTGRAWPRGTMVAVVNVVEPPLRPGLADLPPHDAAEIRRQHEARMNWLETFTSSAQREFEAAGLVVERHTLDGEPKSTLLEWAKRWSADCLFIGASGLHQAGAATLGTVASALAGRAHCSVEIVRA